MKKIKNLSTIISDNNLCISRNPKGSNRSWPNSYIKNFYNNFCQDLFLQNKSPNILEINQYNKNNLILWELYFKDIKVDNLEINAWNKDLFKFNKLYDLIIISDYEILFNKKFLEKLAEILNIHGTIIIENIYQKSLSFISLYLKSFLKYNLTIYDFRLDRFILSNCILTIKKDSQIISREKINSHLRLIKYVVFEAILKLFKLLFKLINFIFI